MTRPFSNPFPVCVLSKLSNTTGYSVYRVNINYYIYPFTREDEEFFIRGFKLFARSKLFYQGNYFS